MLDWMRRRTANTTSPISALRSPDNADEGVVEYRRLGKYLQERYADRVVLSFAEIEDLLGFALPERARVQPTWWAVAAQPSSQSEAWTRAGRTAAVNLVARSVVFERDPTFDAPLPKG